MIGTTGDPNLFDFIIHHWDWFLCRPQIENDDLIEMSSSDSSTEEDPLPVLTFPLDEMLRMVRHHDLLSQPSGVIDRPPIACGVVKRIELIGIFPTCRWIADVTMPPDVKELFGGTPFFPLGEYRVANIDIVDAVGAFHYLTFILNKGVDGLLTGYWGAVFGRETPHACWARFQTTGSHETTVREETELKSSKMVTRRSFQEFECIDFCEECFTDGFAPGNCTTQLERILGLTAEFLLQIEWKDWLPDKLLEVRDSFSKLERKRRAKIVRQRAATRQTTIEMKGTPNVKPRNTE